MSHDFFVFIFELSSPTSREGQLSVSRHRQSIQIMWLDVHKAGFQGELQLNPVYMNAGLPLKIPNEQWWEQLIQIDTQASKLLWTILSFIYLYYLNKEPIPCFPKSADYLHCDFCHCIIKIFEHHFLLLVTSIWTKGKVDFLCPDQWVGTMTLSLDLFVSHQLCWLLSIINCHQIIVILVFSLWSLRCGEVGNGNS